MNKCQEFTSVISLKEFLEKIKFSKNESAKKFSDKLFKSFLNDTILVVEKLEYESE